MIFFIINNSPVCMALLNDLNIPACSCQTVVDMLQYFQAMCCFPGSANATEPNTSNRESLFHCARHLFCIIYMISLKPHFKTTGVMFDIYICMCVYTCHRWTCIYSHWWPLYISQYRMETLHYVTMTSSNGNIFRVTGHLCGEFIAHRWISRTKASDAVLWCFLWSAPE